MENQEDKYPLALAKGTILNGRYVLEEVLGQGGFGITYKAREWQTKEYVAIKEFLPDGMALRTNGITVSAYSGQRADDFHYGKECFLNEARTLAEFIGNPNVVRVYSYFEENGTAYFVMEYVEGKSFKEYIVEQGGKIGYMDANKILFPVMDALSAAHAKGIIHRDVTPDNICIMENGAVKLLDFGAARYSLGDRSRSLDVILKPGYAPKEQYTRKGKQGPYTDVYSLAACYYASITGHIPPEAIDRMEEDDLIPPRSMGVELPEYMENAILKGLEVKPADRFQNMEEFKSALKGGPTPEPSIKPRVIGALITAVLAIFAGIGYYFSSTTLIPDVVEMDYYAAETEMKEADLEIAKVEEWDFEDKWEKGTVVSMEGAGKRVKKGTTVTVTVCRGQGTTVPDLRGMSRGDAANVSWIKVGTAGKEFHDTVPEFHIIAQEIKPGTVVEKGTMVMVTVSRGPGATVPDLKGKSEEEATKALTEAGLKIETAGEEFHDEIPMSHIISQEIQPETEVKRETAVPVTYSMGKLKAKGSCGDKAEWTLNEEGVLWINGSGETRDYYTPENRPWKDYRSKIQAVNIEDEITRLGAGAFWSCNNLKRVTASDSLKGIGQAAFARCSSLEQVELPAGVSEAGKYIFYRCSNLEIVTLSPAMNVIPYGTFEECTKLEEIIIPKKVTEIDGKAFKDCNSLKSIRFQGNPPEFGDDVFLGCGKVKIEYPSNNSNWGSIDRTEPGYWEKDSHGWWWQLPNGGYITDEWEWLDGNGDGIAEYYYFGSDGYVLTNKKTPDGSTVDSEGRQVENGIIQARVVSGN